MQKDHVDVHIFWELSCSSRFMLSSDGKMHPLARLSPSVSQSLFSCTMYSSGAFDLFFSFSISFLFLLGYEWMHGRSYC